MRLLAASVAVLAIAASAAVAASTRPALRLVDAQPLVVRATGFAPLEHVTVTATARRSTTVRRLRAGTRGGFTVRFATTFDHCTGVTQLRAVGARSGVVAIRPSPRPCVELQD
jgi:hypothetical protein